MADQTTLEVLTIPEELCIELARLALKGKPDEVCGLLAARDGQIVNVYPAKNVAPENRRSAYYLMSPHDQVRIHEDAEKTGAELVAVYHSHPGHSPNPSMQDVDRAYQGMLYVIVGLKPEIVIRAWRLDPEDDVIFQVPIQVV